MTCISCWKLDQALLATVHKQLAFYTERQNSQSSVNSYFMQLLCIRAFPRLKWEDLFSTYHLSKKPNTFGKTQPQGAGPLAFHTPSIPPPTHRFPYTNTRDCEQGGEGDPGPFKLRFSSQQNTLIRTANKTKLVVRSYWSSLFKTSPLTFLIAITWSFFHTVLLWKRICSFLIWQRLCLGTQKYQH